MLLDARGGFPVSGEGGSRTSAILQRNRVPRKRLRLLRETPMAREIEIKLRVSDVHGFRIALKRMRARLVLGGTGRVHEWNTVFDTAHQDLKKSAQLLRIRVETLDKQASRSARNTHQRALLTFKRPAGGRTRNRNTSSDGSHKVREEIELQIADADALTKIFAGLDLRPWFHYEKYRTTFHLPASKRWAKGLLIELDETPIGTFVELEGPPAAIDRAARELGFSKTDYILTNYLGLQAEECKRRGTKMGNMVFGKRK
jgi:adenylate cyclase, class 2